MLFKDPPPFDVTTIASNANKQQGTKGGASGLGSEELALHCDDDVLVVNTGACMYARQAYLPSV